MITRICFDDICREEHVSNKMLKWIHNSIKHLPGRTWSSFTHVFIPVHLTPPEIGCRHWVAFVLSLRNDTASCFDPLKASQAPWLCTVGYQQPWLQQWLIMQAGSKASDRSNPLSSRFARIVQWVRDQYADEYKLPVEKQLLVSDWQIE